MKASAPVFSIITPTHGSPFLAELYSSIRAQVFTDWEWVIAPNNGALIPPEIRADPRVRICSVPFLSSHVGALKKFAFMQGRGRFLVEADHDDLLLPGCLSEIVSEFCETTGFVYSYAAHLGQGEVFSRSHGWEYEWFDYAGARLMVPKTFDASPGSLAYGWYAPNHVRAWSREAYGLIGGHDPAMSIADDFDLLARTYLRTRMKLIPKPLYIYRITGGNTFLKRTDDIQKAANAVYDKYIHALAERWCNLTGLYRLNLGSDRPRHDRYVSLDSELPCDVIYDPERGIPFPDGSAGIVQAHDVLQFIADPRHFMSEVFRVLADGGWFFSSTPSTDGRGAWQNPLSVSSWNQNSFWNWTRPDQAKLVRDETVRFQEFRLDTLFPSPWHETNNIPYVRAHLRAVKSGARRPHLLHSWPADQGGHRQAQLHSETERS